MHLWAFLIMEKKKLMVIFCLKLIVNVLSCCRERPWEDNWQSRGKKAWPLQFFHLIVLFYFSHILSPIPLRDYVIIELPYLLNYKVPVAAVVVMACNHADYLERTIKSILKYVFHSCASCTVKWLAMDTSTDSNLFFILPRYQTSVASKYPLFVSQVPTYVVVLLETSLYLYY